MKQQQKTVQIIARVEFTSDLAKVCYRVRSSDGAGEYTTCLFDGKATSCTCPSRRRCYHMEQVEIHEAATQETRDEHRVIRECKKQLRRERAEFPYGLNVPACDGMNGTIISDVQINSEGIHYVDVLLESGDELSISILDLQFEAQVRTAVRKEMALAQRYQEDTRAWNEGLVQAPNGNWITTEQLATVPDPNGWAIPEGKSLVRDGYRPEQDADESNEEAVLDRWTDEELMLHATLNRRGGRLMPPKLTASATNAEKRLAACGLL